MNALLSLTLITIIFAIIMIILKKTVMIGSSILVVGILFAIDSLCLTSHAPSYLYALSILFIGLGIYYIFKAFKKRS